MLSVTFTLPQGLWLQVTFLASPLSSALDPAAHLSMVTHKRMCWDQRRGSSEASLCSFISQNVIGL
jgi:hypothetical protein